MSIRVMASVFQHFPEGGTRKLTLLCLADHANDAGSNCYPSIASIAKRIGRCESQARRNVHSLIESGFVSVEPGTELGGGSSRRYRINLERLTPSADATPCMDATICENRRFRKRIEDASMRVVTDIPPTSVGTVVTSLVGLVDVPFH